MQFKTLSAGLASALLLSIVGVARAQSPAGTFASVGGEVELRRGTGEPQRPGVGDPFLAGDELRTGDTGRVRILMNDETILDLASSTQVALEVDATPARGRTTVKLNEGILRARVYRAGGTPPAFEVETPTALVRSRRGDIIVAHEAGDGGSEVVAVSGEAQVQGTLGVIGKGVELTAGRATRVPGGGLPAPSRVAEDDQVATYQRGLVIIGTGSDDHLDVGHPLVAGHLLSPADRPELPASAPAAVMASYLQVGPPGETLIEQLSPDLRTNTQPFEEYLLAEPGIQPPPVED